MESSSSLSSSSSVRSGGRNGNAVNEDGVENGASWFSSCILVVLSAGVSQTGSLRSGNVVASSSLGLASNVTEDRVAAFKEACFQSYGDLACACT